MEAAVPSPLLVLLWPSLLLPITQEEETREKAHVGLGSGFSPFRQRLPGSYYSEESKKARAW